LSTEPADIAKWIAWESFWRSCDRPGCRDADALELRGTLRVRPIGRGLVTDQRKVDDLVRAADNDLRAAIAVNPNQAAHWND